MANRENADFVARDDKSIQCDVSGMSIGNDQLAQVPFHLAAYQRMSGEIVDRRLNGGNGVLCGIGIFVAQRKKCALDVIQSQL